MEIQWNKIQKIYCFADKTFPAQFLKFGEHLEFEKDSKLEVPEVYGGNPDDPGAGGGGAAMG